MEDEREQLHDTSHGSFWVNKSHTYNFTDFSRKLEPLQCCEWMTTNDKGSTVLNGSSCEIEKSLSGNHTVANQQLFSGANARHITMTHHSNPDSHIVSPGVLYHNSLTLQISNDLLDFTLSVGVFFNTKRPPRRKQKPTRLWHWDDIVWGNDGPWIQQVHLSFAAAGAAKAEHRNFALKAAPLDRLLMSYL